MNGRPEPTWVLEPDKELPYMEGLPFEGLSLNPARGNDGWFLVVRSRRGGKALVCYIFAPSPWDCWNNFAIMAGHRKGGLEWKADKYRR